jgi:hypothetical protein
MDATSDTAHTTKLSAEILFGVSLAFVLSIFLLNSSLGDLRERRNKQDDRYRALSEMVDRLHSYRAKDGEFFENLVVASLETESQSGRHRDQYPSLFRKGRLWEIRSVETFGAKAANVLKIKTLPSERESEFRAFIAEAFKDDKEVALFINNEIVPRLATIDTPAGWEDISSWIAFGKYLNSGQTIPGDGVGITFGKRFIDQPGDDEDRFYVYRLLLSTPEQSSVDDELLALWKQSYNETRSSVTPLPGVAVSLFGLSISADAVVAGAAPILIVLQFLFLIHWERRADADETSRSSFIFPSFACPNDPFNGPIPKTLGEIAQRLIWTLFLILPISLLSVGLLTRYDLLYPLRYFGEVKMTLFDAEMSARSKDALSSTLDWVTLICVALSALVVLNITRSQSKSAPRKGTNGRNIWIITLILIAACISSTLLKFYFRIAHPSNASDVEFNMSYFAAFGVLCSLCLGLALYHQARFFGFLSVIGLVVFVFHFIRF